MASTDALLDTLELLAATPGKKDKLDIVKTLGEFEQGILRRALDPAITYGVANLESSPYAADPWSDAELRLLEDLASRKLTGNEALDQIRFSMRELSQKSGELLRRVILKDLRCGVGVTLLNEAFPGSIQEFPYMRCSLPAKSNIAKWDWSVGIFVQLKADGMYASCNHEAFGKAVFVSRQGQAFPQGSLGQLEMDATIQLDTGTQTHGELLVYKGSEMLPRQIGNGILNSLQQGGTLEHGYSVCFEAWDQIPLRAAVAKGKLSTPYKTRLDDLRHQVGSGCRQVSVIPTKIVHSQAEAMTVYRSYLAQGLEGVICKHPGMVWADNTSKDQVKFKLAFDVDLKIVGFKEGNGKNAATFGSIVCRTADDMLEVSVSGFSDALRKQVHDARDDYLGGVMTVKSTGIMAPSESNSKHSLFLPRHVEFRKDKVLADNLKQVQNQFEAALACA